MTRIFFISLTDRVAALHLWTRLETAKMAEGCEETEGGADGSTVGYNEFELL
jgi:hypothetical protein